MKIKFYCPRWGAEHLDYDTFLPAVKHAGYAGIEWFPYAESYMILEVVDLLQKYELEHTIVMAVTARIDNFKEYLRELEKQLWHLAGIETGIRRPQLITAQTGREYYSDEQIAECIAVCDRVSVATGIPIHQETHRNKWAFAAHVVERQIKNHPDLVLTLDVSHWFCVSESYLEDQQAAVELAIRHTRHLHARIGHIEGPQVWEPASEEYAVALEEHLRIWDKWVTMMKQGGASHCTITPEFGPPPYLVFANRQGTPFEEQWRLNLWMKNLLAERYANY